MKIIKKPSLLQILQIVSLYLIIILLLCIFWSLNRTFRQFVFHEYIEGLRFHSIELDDPFNPREVSTRYIKDFYCKSEYFVFNINVKSKQWEYPKNLSNKPKLSLKETCDKKFYSEPGEAFNYPVDTYVIKGLFNEFFVKPEDFKAREPSQHQMLEYLSEKFPDTYTKIQKNINRKEKLDYLIETKQLPPTLKELNEIIN